MCWMKEGGDVLVARWGRWKESLAVKEEEGRQGCESRGPLKHWPAIGILPQKRGHCGEVSSAKAELSQTNPLPRGQSSLRGLYEDGDLVCVPHWRCFRNVYWVNERMVIVKNRVYCKDLCKVFCRGMTSLAADTDVSLSSWPVTLASLMLPWHYLR